MTSIAPISSAAGTGPLDLLQAPNLGLVSSGTESRDEFLFLLTTQLKNQDPLSPQKPEELVAQLAVFSQLEQLLNLSGAVEGQTQLLAQNVLASQNALALGAVGRVGTFALESATRPMGSGDALDVVIPQDGGVTLILETAGGATRRFSLGEMLSGRHSVVVPPGVVPGTYTATVEVMGGDGALLSGAVVTEARIDGVRFTPSGTQFRVNGSDVPVTTLLELSVENENPNSSPS